LLYMAPFEKLCILPTLWHPTAYIGSKWLLLAPYGFF
jgi:hypothetical protein